MKRNTPAIYILPALLVVFPFFFIGGPEYYSHRLLKEAWHLGHILFFGGLAFVVGCVLGHKVRNAVHLFLITLAIVAAGAAVVECVQAFVPGRMVNWSDFILGVGGGAAVAVFSFLPEKWKRWSRYLRAAAVVVVACMLVPFGRTAIDEYRARRDFPLLAGFETSLELSRWSDEEKMARVREPVLAGNFSARLHLPPGKYSGVALQHFPQNWKNAERLLFSISNPGEPVMLHYRVHDATHRGDQQLYGNRFNGKRWLVRRWNTVVVLMEEIKRGPEKRDINLAEVEGFGMFIFGNREERGLYIDEVELTLKAQK